MSVQGAARPAVRRPAISDVARLAAVSHQTVSRVLNDHPYVRPETRRRVLDAIGDLGYRRNAAARALVTDRSSTIGVVASDSPLYGPTSTLMAVERAARAEGWFVSVATSHGLDAEAMRPALEQLLDQGVEGIVVIAPQCEAVEALGEYARSAPMVVIGDSEGARGGALTVVVDQRTGARQATEHLLDLGHASVLHVTGPLDWYDARERREGWREAHEVRGIEPPTPLVASWSAGEGYAVGRQVGHALRDGDPTTAILAGNDQLALGMLRAFWELGLDVPADVSVVGFDDIAGAEHFVPPLTTVTQPFEDLGRRCVAALLGAVADTTRGVRGAPELIAPRLVVRASSGSPRG